jgi:hypothetical protein
VSTTESEDFKRGVRAVYDYLTGRAANHYHGNPVIQKQCDYDNELVLTWAEDALEEVSEEVHNEWRSISSAYDAGYQAGLRSHATGRDAIENGNTDYLLACPVCGSKVDWCDCGMCHQIECKTCGLIADNNRVGNAAETLTKLRDEIRAWWNKRVKA